MSEKFIELYYDIYFTIMPYMDRELAIKKSISILNSLYNYSDPYFVIGDILKSCELKGIEEVNYNFIRDEILNAYKNISYGLNLNTDENQNALIFDIIKTLRGDLFATKVK